MLKRSSAHVAASPYWNRIPEDGGVKPSLHLFGPKVLANIDLSTIADIQCLSPSGLSLTPDPPMTGVGSA